MSEAKKKESDITENEVTATEVFNLLSLLILMVQIGSVDTENLNEVEDKTITEQNVGEEKTQSEKEEDEESLHELEKEMERKKISAAKSKWLEMLVGIRTLIHNASITLEAKVYMVNLLADFIFMEDKPNIYFMNYETWANNLIGDCLYSEEIDSETATIIDIFARSGEIIWLREEYLYKLTSEGADRRMSTALKMLGKIFDMDEEISALNLSMLKNGIRPFIISCLNLS